MKYIFNERMTSDINGGFVVFLIGMRINKPWEIHKWIPVALAMPKMINELYKNSELGFICHEQWFGRTTIMVQYWKSYEHLENYAKNKTLNHLPEWAKFNKILSGNGDVGIWHEIYLSQKGNYECLYNNMPRFGLGKAGTHVKVSGKSNSARGKLTNKDGLA